jgi:hypothetical protein
MGNAAREFQLRQKPLAGRGVGYIGPDGLQCDGLTQDEVDGFVDLAHAAAAEEPHDTEPVGDELTGSEGVRRVARSRLQQISGLIVLNEQTLDVDRERRILVAETREVS